MSIFFTTFADRRLARTRKRILEEAHALDVFEDCYAWDETTLSPDFYQTYQTYFYTQSKGFGYYVWKPFMIEKTLEKLPENSYLFYIDVGCVVQSNGKKRLLEYIELLEASGKSVLGFQLEHKEKTWTKMDLLIRMNYTSEEQLNTFQCLSGIILFKNTPDGRAFVRQWRTIMEEDIHWRDDSPSNAPNDPTFQEHRHDQSVYSILLKQYQGVILDDETWWPDKWDQCTHYPFHARRLKF
jgi:hypothetical protein